MAKSRYEDIPDVPIKAPSEQSSLGSLGTGLRHLARTDARIAESLLGAPGDIASGILGLGNLATKAITGQEYLPNELPILPTSESTKKNITSALEVISPEAAKIVEPQTQTEENIDEYIQDLTSFLHPIGGKGNLVRKAVIPTIGHVAKYGAQQLGLSKPWQQGIKVGTMLASSLYGKPSLEKQASQLYNTAEETLPQGIKLSAKPIEQSIDKLRKVLSHGDMTPSKEFIGQRINSLRNVIDQEKQIPLEDALQFIKDFNEFYAEGKVPKVARSYMHELMSGIDKVIDSGKSQAPKSIKSFQDAREIWRTINTSSDVNDFVQNISDKIFKKVTSPLTGYFFGIPQAAAGAAGSKALGGFSKLADRAFRSNKVLKAYANTAASAAKENAAATSRSLLELDKTLNNEFPEYSFDSNKYEAI